MTYDTYSTIQKKHRKKNSIWKSFLKVAFLSSICSSVMLVSSVTAVNPTSSEKNVKQLAIIIDDLGNNMKGTAQMLDLPVKLTVAVMPFLSTTRKDAIDAHKRGFDVLVHMPMEPIHGKVSWLGPGSITAHLSNDEIRSRVERAIDNVPYAIGMNNHMGSKITSNSRIMNIVLDVCKSRGLFFIDSGTTPQSIVPKLAQQKSMICVRNDIFLDQVHGYRYIENQIKKVQKKLEKQHTCVAIGHVGQTGIQTSAVIRDNATKLKQKIQFVGISTIIKQQKGK